MKKLLFMLLMLVPMVVGAQVEVVIDGIAYNITKEDKTAEVIKKSGEKYSGNINIPESVEYEGVTCTVKTIKKSAFYECSNLTSVIIPNSVTCIGDFAFSDCSGLSSVTIPNSVTSIGEAAFQSCKRLTSVTIPNSVTCIKGFTFCNCPGLTSVTIPKSVTCIGEFAFDACTGLTSVSIPNSVTSIGMLAFEGCRGLTSVTIPNSVTSIGEGAFFYCLGLTSVIIGNSVTTIGESTFQYCISLTSVTIGNSVTTIADYAFANCEKLETVTCLAVDVPTTGAEVFNRTDIKKATLRVPEKSAATYSATEPWSNFGTIECIDDDANAIITAEKAEKWGKVEYYTLDGKKVAQPARAGVFVVKKDGETRVVVVKN